MDNGHRARKTSNVAVKIHEYFSRFRSNAWLVVLSLEILGAFAASAAAWFLWQQTTLEPAVIFILSAAALIIINVVIGWILLRVTTKPLSVVTQAIAHVSKDPVVTPPPELSHSYERSGLKDLVQTVYELALTANMAGGDKKASSGMPADFFQQIADHSPCGIIALGATDALLYANAAAPVTDIPGGGKALSLNFEVGNDLIAWLKDCRTNKVRDTHLWLRVADKLPGEEGRRIFDIIGYYQKDDAAGIEAVLVTFDRTSVYATVQEDMDFIALAAHELRGPITVIRGYLDVFNEELADRLDAEQRQLLDRLQVSAERLSGYVNNILNVSRYDRHQFKIHPQEEQLTTIVSSLLPDLELRASTQGRKLSVQLPANLPTIAADRSSLGEVITNLVDNGIKYSQSGDEVIVRATVKDDLVEVTVQDSGIGMPGAVVGNLFNRFYRSHRSKQTVAGTGLGLYICKAIVEAHGGTIWVSSVEGQGSTFGFTLPTYASVADKLKSGDNKDRIVQRSEGWIKNHAMYRG